MALSDESAAKTQCNTPGGRDRIWQVETAGRLEVFLLECIPHASRESLRRALAAGACRVDGVVRRKGFRLRGGERVELAPDVHIGRLIPENIRLEILFENDDLVAVNKPPGMLVHPTVGVWSGTVANALAGMGYAGIHFLHRLDRGTSGVLLAARHLEKGSPLTKIFAAREVEKIYLAVVSGRVAWAEITVRLPIGRDPGRRPQWNVSDGGAAAETRLRVLRRADDRTLVEARPVTGRTNQIRIHCAAAGYPIVGDAAYGGAEAPRLLLHAWQLALPAPGAGIVRITAGIPSDFPDITITK